LFLAVIVYRQRPVHTVLYPGLHEFTNWVHLFTIHTWVSNCMCDVDGARAPYRCVHPDKNMFRVCVLVYVLTTTLAQPDAQGRP
jgi:hypothetical protein